MDADALASHRRLWQEPLRGIADTYPLSALNPTDDLLNSSVLWFYSEETHESDLPLPSLVEGLTVLAFLAQTDASAWLDELKLVWHQENDVDWIDDHLAPQALSAEADPWVVGMNLLVRSGDDLDMVETYIVSQEANTTKASRSFRLICRGLKSSMVRPTVPICVELDFDDEDCGKQRRLLRRIIELTRMQLDATEQTGRTIQGRLCITEVRLMRSIDVKGLHYVAQLNELGVRIHSQAQLYARRGSKITSSLVESLQSLLHTTATTIFKGIQSVVVTDETPRQFLPALLSAIQDSQCVNAVNVIVYGEDATAEDVQAMWKGIASALFSPDSKHCVQKLELALNDFGEDDFEAFRSTYTSHRARSGRSGRVDSAGETDLLTSTQRVTASRFSLVKPSMNGDDGQDRNTEDGHSNEDGGEDENDDEDSDEDEDSDGDDEEEESDSRSVFESSVPLGVRKVDRDDDVDDEEWCTVVLPGAGRAWVRRDEIQASSIEETVNSARSIRQISVSTMTETSIGWFAKLISLIGSETQHLRVGAVYRTTTAAAVDQWCRQVLSQCTKLERLELASVTLSDLRPLVDCIVREGRCIRTLLLGYVKVKSLDHICDFFRVLSDASHPFTAQLEKLSLALVLDNIEVLVEPLIQMLNENRTLHTINISFCRANNARALERPQRVSNAHLDRYRNEQVAVRTAPLDVQSKLAFISAVHGQASLKSGCRSEIDTGIMSIIFQLAAPSRVRRVRFLNR